MNKVDLKKDAFLFLLKDVYEKVSPIDYLKGKEIYLKYTEILREENLKEPRYEWKVIIDDSYFNVKELKLVLVESSTDSIFNEKDLKTKDVSELTTITFYKGESVLIYNLIDFLFYDYKQLLAYEIKMRLEKNKKGYLSHTTKDESEIIIEDSFGRRIKPKRKSINQNFFLN